ncbi:hypothetical protein Tco_0684686 [Tanacetum coccineum]
MYESVQKPYRSTLSLSRGGGGRGVKEKDGVAQSAKEKSEAVKDVVAPSVTVESRTVSSYVRPMIEVRADVKLKDTIVAAMPKLIGEGLYTYECPMNIGSSRAKNMKKPSQAPRGVSVGPKVGFKPTKQTFRVVPKQTNANTSGGKKKDVELPKEVSNSVPFDVLNSVKNDDELGTNGGSSNLASKKADSSGSSFWNVGSSSLSTTPIVEKVDKIEKLIIDGQVTLVDDEGKLVEKFDYLGDHDSKDEMDSYGNGDYDFDPYDDDMYENQDIPDKIQEICYNLDIKVKGRKKK